MDERAGIEAIIAALEAQRPTFGDAEVDAAAAPLRKRLVEPGADQRIAARAQQLEHVTILFVDVVRSGGATVVLDVKVMAPGIGSCDEARAGAFCPGHGGTSLQRTRERLDAGMHRPEASKSAMAPVRSGAS